MGIKSWLAGKVIGWAKPGIKAQLSVERLTDILCDGVDWAAGKGFSGISDERLEAMTKGFSVGAGVCGLVADAVRPTSDGGREFSAAERGEIKAELAKAVNMIVTQEQVDRLVDDLCDRVIESL